MDRRCLTSGRGAHKRKSRLTTAVQATNLLHHTTEGKDMSETEDGAHYLIMKRGLYERPNHQGYTGIRDHAGRYSLEEAKHMFRLSNGECRWVHEDQAQEFLPAAWDDLVIKHLLEQRDALRAELAALHSASPFQVTA